MPIRMKITPVILRAHSSKSDRFLKTSAIFLNPKAIKTATARTGSPVPAPKRAGIAIDDLPSSAAGIRPPKKRAAETGQKDKANKKPRKNAPGWPHFVARCPSLSKTEMPGSLILMRSKRNIPTRTRMGPINLLRYAWR